MYHNQNGKENSYIPVLIIRLICGVMRLHVKESSGTTHEIEMLFIFNSPLLNILRVLGSAYHIKDNS